MIFVLQFEYIVSPKKETEEEYSSVLFMIEFSSSTQPSTARNVRRGKLVLTKLVQDQNWVVEDSHSSS